MQSRPRTYAVYVGVRDPKLTLATRGLVSLSIICGTVYGNTVRTIGAPFVSALSLLLTCRYVVPRAYKRVLGPWSTVNASK